MVVKRGKKYWVIHAHAQKAGSATDKPKGSVIKCFSTNQQAQSMHSAILASQAKRKNR